MSEKEVPLFLAVIAALYVTMSVGLSVCRSVGRSVGLSVCRNEFQGVQNALKVPGMIMFQCIMPYE